MEQPPVGMPEAAPERVEVGKEAEPTPEQVEVKAAETPPEPAPAPAAPGPAPAVLPPEEKDALRMRVERTLEDNLWKIYLSLPDAQRERFKAGGEMCAATLRNLLDQGGVRPRQALNPITRWLKLIPNVLWAFLYQEAKIKTDKFMRLHKEHQEEKANEIA